MKHFFSLLLLIAVCIAANAQKMYATSAGQLKIKLTNKSGSVEAISNQVESRWLENNGQFFLSAPYKDFQFEDQFEHPEIIEQFSNAGKFPKISFKGFIQDIQHIDLTSSGGNEVMIDGVLTIHGIPQKIVFSGNLTVLSSGKIMLKADLKIKLADYQISFKDSTTKYAADAFLSLYCMYE